MRASLPVILGCVCGIASLPLVTQLASAGPPPCDRVAKNCVQRTCLPSSGTVVDPCNPPSTIIYNMDGCFPVVQEGFIPQPPAIFTPTHRLGPFRLPCLPQSNYQTQRCGDWMGQPTGTFGGCNTLLGACGNLSAVPC